MAILEIGFVQVLCLEMQAAASVCCAYKCHNKGSVGCVTITSGYTRSPYQPSLNIPSCT